MVEKSSEHSDDINIDARAKVFSQQKQEESMRDTFISFCNYYFGGAAEKLPLNLDKTGDILYQARISLRDGKQYYSVVLALTFFVGVLTFIGTLFLSTILSFAGLATALTLSLDTEVTALSLIGYSTGIFTFLSVILTFSLGWYYPRYVSGIRQSQIDQSLPYAVTYMYSLTHGGMQFNEVLNRIADSEGTYGPISDEFDLVVKSIEQRGKSLPNAFVYASRNTPSEKFREFCEGLQNRIESGGKMDEYLKRKSDDFLQQAEQDQEDFIQTLAMLGQIYVIVFVAAPLFLIVIVFTISLSSGGGIFRIMGIVYVLLPIANMGFFILLDTLTPDTDYLELSLESTSTKQGPRDIADLEQLIDDVGGDPVLENFLEKERESKLKKVLLDPIEVMVKDPAYSLTFTLPITFIYLLFVLITGIATPSIDAMVQNPPEQTAVWIVLPLFIIMTPYMLFYEYTSRRQSKIARQFPDALEEISEANEMGQSLQESIMSSADNTSGIMGDEFRRMAAILPHTNDIRYSLIQFANRMQTYSVTRTIKMLVDSLDSSGDVSNVLEVAARDVRKQYLLKKRRFQELSLYTVIIIVSFVVYLIVVYVLDNLFLDTLSGEQFETDPGVDADTVTNPGAAEGGGAEDTSIGVEFESIPTQEFRTALFHSTIIQALGNGLLAGQLGSEDWKKGIKISLVLIAISTIVFLIV